MWIRDVDLPERLVEAHRSGELVLFLGAGVSAGPPSNLPTFAELAATIMRDRGQPVDVIDGRHDVALGELDRAHHVDVHDRVAQIIGASTSRPNPLHEAAVALARESGEFRVVTTNYDLHLSTVVGNDHRGPVEEYVAPALPMGDDFTGLVYLHGNLRQESRHLVVTDRDFGRAYLTHAWAARFLERMFRAHSVLFLGYSHNDVVVSYLARGLDGSQDRFALTDQPNDPRWEQLGIEAIGYALGTDKSHDELHQVLAGWAQRASWGLLDHHRHVAELVAVPPSQVPEEASYLESLLSDSVKAGIFAELARGSEWLEWANQQEAFRDLFSPRLEPRASARPLAFWFAEHFVCVEAETTSALRVLVEHGGGLSETLWQAIAQQLHRLDGPRPKWLVPWVTLLLDDPPRRTSEYLDFALSKCHWPEDRDIALALLDHLTNPRRVFAPGLGRAARPRSEIEVPGKDYWLRKCWADFFVPRLGELSPHLMPMFDRHLRRATLLLRAMGDSSNDFDPFSYARSAIEPHGQDAYLDGVYFLVDGARDVLEALLRSNSSVAASYIETWFASGIRILERLAVHGWTERTDVEASDKVRWIIANNLVFSRWLRHEVFRLVAQAVANADQTTADTLVSQVLIGPPESEHFKGERRTFEIFNALSWIAKAVPKLRSATEALAAIRHGHPNFSEREHPDLFSWSTTGTFAETQLPFTADELHRRLEADSEAAVADVLTYVGLDRPFEGPSWSDALTIVAAVSERHPEDGLLLVKHPGVQDEAVYLDVVQAVLRGWGRAELTTEETVQILNWLLKETDLRGLVQSVSRFLLDQSESDQGALFTSRQLARSVASRLLEVGPAGVPSDASEDPLGTAVNHWVGLLTQFWLHVIAHQWRAERDAWSGLPPELKAVLDALLACGDERSEHALVVLASQLHFLFGADRHWAESSLLPSFDCSADASTGIRCWSGYLYWGRWHDRLLEAGLLDHYLSLLPHADALRDELRVSYCSHLASIAILSDIDPLESRWLRQFTASASGEVRTLWARQVGHALRQAHADLVRDRWEGWMRSYWEQRLASVPVALDPQEASRFAEWTLHLGDAFPESVELVRNMPARLIEHATLLYDLEESPLLTSWPTEATALLVHLLEQTTPPFYGCPQLGRVVAQLLRHLDASAVDGVAEQAMRLGCLEAATWLR